MISGVNNDGYDTMRFILYDSDIWKNYGENTTILAWIHSHVETNKCDFLSSVDVHNQRALEHSFPHIQAIVVELLHTERINHEFYILTTLGKTNCSKPGFHNECRNENYYKQIEGDVSGEAIGERIYDFSSGSNFPSKSADYHYPDPNPEIEHQTTAKVHLESDSQLSDSQNDIQIDDEGNVNSNINTTSSSDLNRRKRKHKSNAEKLSSDTDSSKSPSKWFAIEKETFTCKICYESFDNIKIY